jgi:hypothetical protein
MPYTGKPQALAPQVSRGDRDRALETLHMLEAASDMAGPGRGREAITAAFEQLTPPSKNKRATRVPTAL